MADPKNSRSKTIKSMGLVFGDIGTSPIYTMGAILIFILPTVNNIIGLLSLIIWTLLIIISVQYVWLAMSLGTKGEGGTIVLKGILATLLKPGIALTFASGLTIIGIALFIGDGIITPAISILSAVEGIRLIPGFEQIGVGNILIIAALIAIALFYFQKKGTEKVAWAFGPIMLLWFIALAVTGALSILSAPRVLFALNPYYAVSFLAENGIASLFVLSAVILCVTGGEALYADMGHLGREPIIRAWWFVLPALVLSYLGQGAFILQSHETHTVLFTMIYQQSHLIFIPFLLLSIAATVIASQAMISGMFSIVYQGMTTRLLPKMKVEYTSPELRSQIYIDAVNWLLLAAVLAVMFQFQSSENLASAYGLAVSGTMLISTILMLMIFSLRKNYLKALIAVMLVGVDLAFLLSTFLKIPAGAYWSFFIAMIPLIVIVTFIRGQDRLHQILKSPGMDEFLPQYTEAFATFSKIRGTALYFTGNLANISPYIPQIFFKNEIMYEHNIFVSIQITDKPFGITKEFDTNIAPGLHIFTIRCGYMEIVDIVPLLRSEGIQEKTIFYGIENIVSDQFFWKIYSLIKKVTPPFVQFYALPPGEIHGVVTRVVM